MTYQPVWPTPEQALADARGMYQRVLAPWACEVLALKRAGLAHPTWHRCRDARRYVARRAA
jgi:hypothetical protein